MEENCYIYRYRPLENFYKWNDDEKKYIENKTQHAFDELQNDYFYCSKLKDFDDFNEVMFDIDFSSGNKENFAIFAKYYHYCLIKHIIDLKSHSDEMNKKVFQEYRNSYAVIGYDSKDFVQENIIKIISRKQYSQCYDLIGTTMAYLLSSVKKSKNTTDFFKNLNKKYKNIEINNIVKNFSDSDKVDKMLFQGIKNKKICFLVFTHLILFSSVEDFEKTRLQQQNIIFTDNEINNFRKNFINNLYVLVLTHYTRTCCFSENNNSDYMWSKYANGSKGVCLIYKATKKEDDYFMDSIWRSDGITIFGIHLKKVKYIKNRRRIDFFKYCLGAREICKNYPWYSKEQIFAGMFNIAKYRKSKTEPINYNEDIFPKLVKMQENLITTKIDAFKQEKEIRFVLDDNWMPKDGKYHCDFSCLDGIIFGENIDENCKEYIVNLIEKKCNKEKRDIKTFNFYKYENRKVIKI